jgi:uncharacterized membrane-anchored protein
MQRPLFILGIVASIIGLAWFVDRPGGLVIEWQGYRVETSAFTAVLLLTVILGFLVLWLQAIGKIIGHWEAEPRERGNPTGISTGNKNQS